MKDLPHHVKQLNRKVIRSNRREKEEEVNYDKAFRIEESKEQKRKKEKIQKRQENQAHVPHPQTSDERNQLMNDRVPIRKERSHHFSPPPQTSESKSKLDKSVRKTRSSQRNPNK